MRSCGVLFGCDILDLMYSYVDLRQRRYPVTRSLDLKILRRRFSAVAYDLELDLLAFIERGQTRPLHSRNVHKHIAPATLRLDESIAFGRIKPLDSHGRHQRSASGKRGRPPNLHVPVTGAIRIRPIDNGLVTLIPANRRDRLPRSQRPRQGRRSEWCASQATRHIALVRSVDVDKPGHDTMAFTALPRYFSAMIAWTNIEERHPVKIARHPVFHPPFRAARRSRDMRWQFRRFPVRHGARSRRRRRLAVGARQRVCRSYSRWRGACLRPAPARHIPQELRGIRRDPRHPGSHQTRQTADAAPRRTTRAHLAPIHRSGDPPPGRR